MTLSRRAHKAIELLGPLAVSLAKQRPKGTGASIRETDAARLDVEAAIGLLRGVATLLDRRRR